ncbi:sulfurtransferase [Geotalea uraniireducens]|uniref:Sulfurtransferase n=1 Tax=Geotalea uraniireducens TaxID=351604 RepID=A0ABM8ENW7_9BACT|nr:putative Ig domain-containing protein [Geotalea uraniireducens]BDV43726.1 sulfurtransferase [Geotalea uraniireducens]
MSYFVKLGRVGSLLFVIAMVVLGSGRHAAAADWALGTGSLNSSASVEDASTYGLYSWLVDGKEYVSQLMFYCRVGNSGPELPVISNEDPDGTFTINRPTALADPAVLPLSYTALDGTYRIELTYKLTGYQAGSKRSKLTRSVKITNLTGAPLDFHFFAYADYDLSLPFSYDNAVITNNRAYQAGFNSASDTNGKGYTVVEEFTMPPSRHSIDMNQFVGTLANGSTPYDLDNFSGPFTTNADIQYAFQWDLALAANGSVSFDIVDNVYPSKPLVLAKSHGGECVGYGQPVTYTYVYDNTVNSVDLHNLVITDTVPAGLGFVSATDGGSYDPASSAIVWNLPLAGAGLPQQTVQATVLFNSTADITASNTANKTTILSDETYPRVVQDVSLLCNHPPTINSKPGTTAVAGTVYQYQVTASDPDAGTVLQYALDNAPTGMSISTGGLITWTPAMEQGGTFPVTLSVSDGALSTSQTYSLAVSVPNRAPVISSTPATAAVVGQLYSYQVVANDPDGDTFYYLLSAPTGKTVPPGITIDRTTGLISWTPGSSTPSSYDLVVTVMDMKFATATQSFTVTVTDSKVNEPPTISSTPVMSATAGVAYTYHVVASDPNGDSLTFGLSAAPAGMEIDSLGNLAWTPTVSQAGSNTVTIAVSDGALSASQTFTVEVVVPNRAPTITSSPVTVGVEGAAYRYPVEASDPDGDLLSYALTAAPAGMTINSSGVVSWSPTYSDAGSYTVTAKVSDPAGFSATQSYTLIIADVNRTPSVTAPANQAGAEGATVSLAIQGSDPDGDTVSYSASGLPEGLSINATSGVISGTIGYNAAAASPYTVTITVSDPSGAKGTASFSWSVSNVNRTPSVTAPANQAGAEGATVSLAIQGSDPDGDTVSYSASGLPEGLSINATSGVISGTIGYNAAAASPYTVTITVSDPSGAKGTASFSWSVSNVNRTPSVTAPANQAGAEGATVSLAIQGSDPDGDTVSYSASGLPEGLSINATSGVISGTIGYNAAAASPYTVTITVSDPSGAKGTASFSWSVSNVNRAPSVTAPANQAGAEGATVSLAIQGSDPDGDTVSYSASGLPEGLSINATSGVISGTIGYNAAAASPYTVTITVSDPSGAKGTASFSWSVSNVNRAPSVTAPANQAGAEGATVSLAIQGSDPDGDTVSYSASGLPEGLSINATSGVISGTIGYNAAAASPYTVTITVSDPSGAKGTASFSWSVSNTNRAPVFTSTPPSSATEGKVYSYAPAASDADGDPLSYALVSGPSGMTMNGGVLSWTPTAAQAGTAAVTVSVGDGTAVTEQSFTISVSKNNAPTFTSTPLTMAVEDVAYRYVVVASDSDGDSISYSLVSGPSGMALNGATVEWTPSYSQAGSYPVTVRATDSRGAATDQSYTLVVTDVNRAPSVTAPANQAGAEGATVSLAIQGSDPDGDTVSYSASGLPEGLSINATSGVISGTIGYNAAAASPYTVTITVSDPSGAKGTASFSWSVSNVNRAPSVTAPANQAGAEGATVSLAIQGSDPDGDTVSYSASGLPEGLSINATSGVISGTIGYNAAAASPYTVTITVSDPSGAKGTASFSWSVSNVNRAPSVTAPANQAGAEGATVSLAIQGSDPDGDTVSYSASGLPEGLSINATSGVISGTIGYNAAAASPYTVTITVSDPSGAKGTASFSWSVSNTNRAPVFTSTPPSSATEGKVYSYAPAASDADGDPLSYALVSGPSGMTMNGGVLSWTPTAAQAGTAAVTVSVGDGTAVTEQSFTISVSKNNAPTFTSTPLTMAVEDVAYRYVVVASDSDGDSISYSLVSGPSGMALNGATVEWTPSYSQAGSYPVTVRATDSRGAATDQSYTLVVTDVNRAPSVTAPANQAGAEGATVSLAIQGSDPDGDTVSYSASGLPEGLSINATSGVISGTIGYNAAAASPYTVTITVSDPSGAKGTASFSWSVSNVNRAPSVTAPANQAGAEGATVSLAIQGSDPDGDTVSYSASGLPEGLSINATSGVISGTIGYNAAAASPYTVTITVSDPSGAKGTASFSWSVSNTNRAPVFTSTPPSSATEGKVYSYAPAASDADGDPLSYALVSGPSGMTMNGGVLSWTPTAAQAGTAAVTVSVGDGTAVTEQSFTISITSSSVNLPPQITSTPPSVATVKKVYSYNVDATDPSGASLRYSLDSKPDGMKINSLSGLISWRPNKTGDYPVVVRVTNAAGLSALQSFSITVLDRRKPPVITSMPVAMATVETAYSYAVTAASSDDEPLSFSLLKKPAGMVIDSETGLITWVPKHDQTGLYQVILRVSDSSGLATTQYFVVRVSRGHAAISTGLSAGGENHHAAVVQAIATRGAQLFLQ